METLNNYTGLRNIFWLVDFQKRNWEKAPLVCVSVGFSFYTEQSVIDRIAKKAFLSEHKKAALLKYKITQ